MNVVILTHYASLYGANQSLIDFVSGAKESNLKFMVIGSESGPLDIELNKLGVPVKHVKMYRLFYSSLYTFFLCIIKFPLQLWVERKIIRIIKPFKPDIIYSNSSVITSGNSVARKMGINHIWHIREFRTMDYEMYYLFGESNLKYKINQADKVVAISDSIKRSLAPEVRSGVIERIYNGVMDGSEAIKYAVRSLNVSQRVRFGIVGVVRESKGQLEAVKALGLLKERFNIEADLVIYGDIVEPSYYRSILMAIEGSALKENVRFMGFESNREKIYDSMDILLVCSLKEGFGRVTAEAMFRGIPVIGRKSGGTEEVVQHEKTGFLYTSMDVLVDRMFEIIKGDDLYVDMSRVSQIFARNNFTKEEYVSKLVSLIKRMG